MLVLAIAGAFMQVPLRDDAPLKPGTITVELKGDDPAVNSGDDADDDPFVRATQDALGDANFIVLPRGIHGRYVANVEVSRQQRGAVTADGIEAKPAAKIGNWGSGIRVTLPSRKTSLHGLVVTRMHIEMRQRRDNRVIWSGTALTVQIEGAEAGSTSAVSAKLAKGLVSQFPVAVQETLSVP